MKKSLILGLILCFTGITSVNAQKGWEPAPFKHWAIGVGVSTAGADIELATTLGYHFQLRAGVAALPYTLSTSYDMGFGSMFEDVDPTILKKAGVNPDEIPSEVSITAGLGLMNGKVLMDIYPFKKLGIHLTAGAYLGSNELLSVGMQMPSELVDALNSVRSWDPDFDFGDSFIAGAPDGEVNMSLTVEKVKPYLGFGLSRAVPKRRLSLNLDCGVMLHGTPKLESNVLDINRMLDDEGVIDIVSKVVAYPVISFRLVGRIF